MRDRTINRRPRQRRAGDAIGAWRVDHVVRTNGPPPDPIDDMAFEPVPCSRRLD
jgi:hypothetical protein